MNLKASEIFESFHAQGIIDDMHGPDTDITRFDPVENCTSSSLVFIDNAEFIDKVIAAKPAAIVTMAKLVESLSPLTTTAILSSRNVRLAQALIRQAYDDHDHRAIEWPSIHPAANIHESATIGEDVIIGAGVVIGRDVTIGRGSIIKANCVLEHDVVIGEDCILHPNVVVASGCEIGNRVTLKSGCVIGMEGFGFAQDEKGKSYRIPQTGRVVIEDDVLMGSQCNVDRATWGETRIRAGSKFDALCHIAHNADIGEDCIMVAQTGVAGSSTLGKRVVVSGQCAITDHVTITDDVTLVQRAGVINNIEAPGVYAGTPIQPVKDYFRNSAVAHKLVDLRKQVRQLEKQLAELNKEKE
ncbi:MAG: UDP-3-O-(3-hydroxymyristoyl)glucosamine N-acyltransferase [Thiotrichales bacterium]|nr:MAG: UDP-3-O-(3-hydroxymyristoyl)glucosamine N-acyltransferase [Thiotrichales bacterium]